MSQMPDAIEEKAFAWSYSRLHDFETCPRKFEAKYLKKEWLEEKSDMQNFGDAVHKAMAEALRTNTPLPTKFKIYQPWVDKVARAKGELLVEDECQWACTDAYKPTPWFAKDVWLRCIADAVKLDLHSADGLPVALVIDWKTGKSANCDPLQLTLTSLMTFLHFPDLLCVRSDFVWLQENRQTTQVMYRKEAPERWAGIIPRVRAMRTAVENENFPPVPGRFCRNWCNVQSCEYWGR
jgi:hypothetical protein